MMSLPDLRAPPPAHLRSVSACVRDLHQRGQLRQLYRGFTLALLRSFPVSACNFAVYELAVRQLRRRGYGAQPQS